MSLTRVISKIIAILYSLIPPIKVLITLMSHYPAHFIKSLQIRLRTHVKEPYKDPL